MQESSREEGSQRHQQESGSTPLGEWVLAFIGFLLVAGSVGFLAYKAATGESTPPALTAEIGAVVPRIGNYLVEVKIFNKGGSTVSNLTVKGRLLKGKRVYEESETTFDYVPSNSHRQGGLFFSQDPREFTLEIRTEGYQVP